MHQIKKEEDLLQKKKKKIRKLRFSFDFCWYTSMEGTLVKILDRELNIVISEPPFCSTTSGTHGIML